MRAQGLSSGIPQFRLEEPKRSTCSSPSSSGSCPASPFPWMGISMVAAFPRIPSVMAREGAAAKASTPAPCKAQHTQFWKPASTLEEPVLYCDVSGSKGKSLSVLAFSHHPLPQVYVFPSTQVHILTHSTQASGVFSSPPLPQPRLDLGDHSSTHSFPLTSAYT